jgi:hypothetical protein
MENYEKNIAPQESEEVLAFQRDVSGERKFVRIGEEVYFVEQNGERIKSSPEAVESAIEKYRYVLVPVSEKKEE